MGSKWGFPGGSAVNKLPAVREPQETWAGEECSMLGWGRCPGGENGNPLQYPCLENPMDRGAWRATVHGVAKSLTGLSVHFLVFLVNALDACVCITSCVWLFVTSWAVSPPGSSWDLWSKNTGMGCHFLLQEIFLTQGSNPHLLYWQAASLPLSHLRRPSTNERLTNFSVNSQIVFCPLWLKVQHRILHAWITWEKTNINEFFFKFKIQY